MVYHHSMDFFASERHFIDHMAPVIKKLGPSARLFTPSALAGFVARAGLERTLGSPGQTVAVASIGDYKKMRGRDIIFFEHGVGLSYSNDHPSYSGGRGRDRVKLYLATNDIVADRQRSAYPEQDVRVIGSPKMDRWHRGSPVPHEEKRIAISFHWDCTVVPETRSAFKHYQRILPALAREFKVYGHAHPRDWLRASSYWSSIGVDGIRNFDSVLKMADLFIVDNSSTLYEFASTNRPVIALNAPWYRRDVHHGLRFWEDVPGAQVDEPGDLIETVKLALNDDVWQDERRRISDKLYPHRGNATNMAVAAIVEYESKKSPNWSTITP